MQTSLEVIYQDSDLVAINKPAGLLVHRTFLDRYEQQFALQILRDQLSHYVYPVHRLDKATSGVLLFALSKVMAKEMANVFQQRQTVKKYLAVVRGYTPKKGVIDYPLKEEKDKIADKRAKAVEAQKAITRYRTLAYREFDYPVGRYQTARYSLVELLPETGRKHQLRRHMKHIFHPVVGDTTHGDGKHNQFFRSQLNSHRLLLAATDLSFIHPVTRKIVNIHADLDEEFNRIKALFYL